MPAKHKKVKKPASLQKDNRENIINRLSDLITIHDRDFNIIYANEAAKRVLGLPSLNGKKLKCYKYYHGEDCPPAECPSCNCIKTGKPVVVERFEPHLNIFVEIHAIPQFDINDNQTGLIHIFRDITRHKLLEEELDKHRTELMKLVEDRTEELNHSNEFLRQEILDRKLAEHALKISEHKYRSLYNNAPDMYHSLNKNKIIIDCNETEARMLGYTKEEIIGRPLTDFFTEESRKLIEKDFPRLIKEKVLRNIDRVFVRKDGTTFPAIINVYAEFDSKGEIFTIRASARDITDIKKLQEREIKLLKELKTIFENFPVGIVYLDKDFKIIRMNKYFSDFVGISEMDLAGKFCYETVGEYVNDFTRKGHEKICSFCKKDICFKNKKTTIIERPLNNKFIRVTTIPEIDETGEITSFMEVVEDITDRKLAETEAIRAGHLASLGELAAGVAHEINNPINGIINYAQIIANKNQPESKEYNIANRIIKESERIAAIVGNLLSFARDNKEEMRPVHINEIMSDSLALTSTQLTKDTINLQINIPADLPAITVIPGQIEQVFLNIISNARYALNEKYPGTHEDKILKITGEQVKVEELPYVRITFFDQGSGISPENINKVMNPFFSTKPANIRTGLGLSISHGIVTNHEGKIMINSVKGEFTMVIIELPVKGKLK
ncbi:MAG: PAS domain S-box protein [Nitrospirae bacterium]|nr:PAS domain S-box protein [Nitrospirota bacterium]